ncbi:MAG: NAD(P)-binding protein, partial [Planctomycetes bacterium]|nr:NAD(P)-binding protein [Planctomycetota bacterium]
MINLTIDGQAVQVPEGATILDAADQLEIEIPTLCFLSDVEPCTSCMVCLVKIEGRRDMVPACGSPAAEGMQIVTRDDTVMQARKAALELLLSEHLGDCMGPCQVACPATMDIPLMIRQIAAGDMTSAMRTVMADIALPSVLGRICSAPCEKSCRRAQIDSAVSICLLKRCVGDMDGFVDEAFAPARSVSTGKRVAIVGGGPAGLGAAYALQISGIDCTVFDQQTQPGGSLLTDYAEGDLPRSVLQADIARVQDTGVTFEVGVCIGRDKTLDELSQQFDAVLVAAGLYQDTFAQAFGLDKSGKGVAFDRATYASSQDGVFVAGDIVRGRKFPIRSLADGKEAAVSMAQYVLGESVTGPVKPFNTRMGRLEPDELQRLLALVSGEARVEPTSQAAGLTVNQARTEAARCLHCDCRKPDTCQLRQLSQAYAAKPTRYKSGRRTLTLNSEHDQVIYESGKCISCGLCVKITEALGERLGLTFVGRGFDLRVAVPLGGALADALVKAARYCVNACPTGALAMKEEIK